MISTMRHAIVDSWLGRLLAITVFVAFVGWGIGDVALYMSSETDVAARVGQHRIAERELAMFLRSELPTIAQKMGVGDPSQIPPMLRQQIAYQILQRLVSRVDILEQARHSGIVVPDSAIRDEVFSLPYFHSAQGSFDRQAFDQQIASQGLTERQVLDMIRDDLAARSVLEPLARSGYVPKTIVRQLAVYEGTQRDVDVAFVPYEQQKIEQVPKDDMLLRYYRNHPWQFMIPEYRKAHFAILSPKTVEPTINLSDEQFKNFYEAQDTHFHQPQTRDIQLVIEPTKDVAEKLANQWKGQGDWQAVKQSAGGSAVDMPHVRPSAIPGQSLRKLVFQSPSNRVVGPYQTDAGWAVFQVTAINAPRNVSLEQAKPEILGQYRIAAAASISMEKQRAFQDAVVGGGMKAAQQIPGVYSASVDVDKSGNMRDGHGFSLPVNKELRDAIVARIFQGRVNDNPSLEDGGNSSLFAVQVDTSTPARLASFNDARQKVVKAWRDAAQHQQANKVATSLYRSFPQENQSTKNGVQLTRNMAFSLASINPKIPGILRDFISHARAGDVSMSENNQGFAVGKVTGIKIPDFDKVSQLSAVVDNDLQQRAGNDLVVTYLQLLAKRYNPHINDAAVQRSLSVAGFGDVSQ